jgi:gamma-butyrobetaine dioxygenase
MLEEPSIKITHRLLPGQAVTFNNRRVLHKRTAFQLNGGQRHLRGMYLNIDFFQSAYEVYANRLNTGECSKHVFNQSW